MEIRAYRDDAADWLRLSESRYEGCDPNFPPLRIAREWLQALQADQVDLEGIAGILREAEQQQNRHDVAFFAFVNDMRRIYGELQSAGRPEHLEKSQSK